jgi:hypothetical protein
MTEITVTL